MNERETDITEDTDQPDADEVIDEVTAAPPETTLAVLLAAGEGSRFNAPEHKLESKLQKKPLIWWAATHALAAGLRKCW